MNNKSMHFAYVENFPSKIEKPHIDDIAYP